VAERVGLERMDGAMREPVLVRCPSCGARYAHDSLRECECGRLARRDGLIDACPDFSTPLEVGRHIGSQGEKVAAAAYEHLFKPFLGQHFQAGPAERVRALELASGPGYLSRVLVDRLQPEWYVSSDIAPELLDFQRTTVFRESPDNVLFARFEATALPFEDEQFDLVIGNSCLHYVLEYEETLREVRRILRPSGIAIFGEPLYTGIVPSFLICALAAMISRNYLPEERRLDEKQLQWTQAIADTGVEKIENMRSNRAALADKDDKHQFSVEDLKYVARDLGFRGFQTLRDVDPESANLRPRLEQFRGHVTQLFAPLGNDSPVDEEIFADLFAVVMKYLVAPLHGQSASSRFSSFCLRK
jgi:ubiquinone/menaquinone biosynthesis C-methylase UbiE